MIRVSILGLFLLSGCAASQTLAALKDARECVKSPTAECLAESREAICAAVADLPAGDEADLAKELCAAGATVEECAAALREAL